MTVWLVLAAGALMVAAAVVRIGLALRRRAVARRLAHDVQVWESTYAQHGGAVVRFAGYDQVKAAAGHARAQRQTPTGQPLTSARRRHARRARNRAEVVPIATRQRAGGDQ